MFLRQGLQFVVTILLARLVAPEQFGVIALLSIFTGVAGAFVDSGFAAALIQKQTTTRLDESTVFWFNVGIGAATSLALFTAAPSIANFFDQPVLVPITRVLSLTIFISSLGSIHFTLLEKALKFRPQVAVGAVSTVLSGTTGIALGWLGFGVWALVWQQVVAAACTSVFIWFLHPWRPTWAFSMSSARSLFGFGGYVLATNILETVYQRFYTILIGKNFGVRDLGFYSRADSTQQLPTGILTTVLMRVAFPVFSVANDDKDRLRRGVRLAVRGAMLLNAPVMLGLAAVSDVLIVTLFGRRWLPAAPILQILCIAGLLWPLHRINLTVLVAQGHSRLFFNLELIKKVLGISLLLGGAAFGVIGVAWATVVSSVAAFYINAYYTGKLLRYGALRQIVDSLPIVCVSVAMATTVHYAGITWRLAAPLALVVQVALGVAFMVAVVSVLRLGAVREAVELVREKRDGRSSL